MAKKNSSIRKTNTNTQGMKKSTKKSIVKSLKEQVNLFKARSWISVTGAREHNLKNTVVGHSHLGGVVYRNTFNGIIWELNAGFCGDTESKALSYTPQRLTKWTKGFGFIDALGPRFIPAGGK